MAATVHFFEEDISFKPKKKVALRHWLKQTVIAEGKKITEINYIFCSDAYLLAINKQYLDHDTYTDIITFNNSETPGKIIGDIFISVERVTENAASLSIPFTDELHRVMVHGVLHLLGYKDKSAADKALMTQKEDHFLFQRHF